MPASAELHREMQIDDIFNEHPIHVGGFELRTREARPLPGIKITIQGWQAAMQYASASQEDSPYWVGDLLAYAEGRQDWREKIDQAVTVTKLSRRTLQNQTTTCRKVKGRARELAPSITHAKIVEGLEPDKQEELLERARDEDMTTRDLERIVSKQKHVLKGQAPEVHEVAVTVLVSVEAKSGTAAERLAWDAVKPYVKEIKKDETVLAARIVGAKARPK